MGEESHQLHVYDRRSDAVGLAHDEQPPCDKALLPKRQLAAGRTGQKQRKPINQGHDRPLRITLFRAAVAASGTALLLLANLSQAVGSRTESSQLVGVVVEAEANGARDGEHHLQSRRHSPRDGHISRVQSWQSMRTSNAWETRL